MNFKEGYDGWTKHEGWDGFKMNFDGWNWDKLSNEGLDW